MKNATRRGEQKEMEYPDAPSGAVMLYNYKEPFMRYEGGYGYQGVLLFDAVEEKIQCHLCGEWFAYLPYHLRREHSTSASEYKEMVGLAKTTALISEKQRALLIERGIERFKNLKAPQKRSEETKKKISESLKNFRREHENKRGTCPEQLIDRLKKKYEELGHTPGRIRGTDKREMDKHIYTKVFGSFERACELAGIPYHKPGDTRKRGKPMESLTTREELLGYLGKFKEINGRDVSRSDIRRGLIPSESRYKKEFGSLKKALKIMG